jgi:hypothetical protein
VSRLCRVRHSFLLEVLAVAFDLRSRWGKGGFRGFCLLAFVPVRFRCSASPPRCPSTRVRVKPIPFCRGGFPFLPRPPISKMLELDQEFLTI